MKNVNLCSRERRGDSSAFTLVELLVVIAIIGILIALLLPAVQAAREAARRMQCSNNLKQFGVAVHNFHDANKRFPASSFDPMFVSRNVARGSYMVLLLPYMEQTAVYDNMMVPYKSTGTGDETIQTVYTRVSGRVRISTFACPSDGNWSLWNDSLSTFTSYRGSRGDLAGSDSSQGDTGAVNPGAGNQFPMRRSWLQAGAYKGGFERVSDGTSNTIMFGEGIIANGDTTPGGSYREKIADGIASHYNQVPDLCLAVKGPNGNFASATQAVLGDANHNLGRRAWSTYSQETHFHTLLPPNSPSCHSGWIYTWVSASSNHTGGVNVCLIDASTHFITDTINTQNLHRRVTSQSNPDNPPSTPYDGDGTFSYGLWGSLGSINGKETASIP